MLAIERAGGAVVERKRRPGRTGKPNKALPSNFLQGQNVFEILMQVQDAASSSDSAVQALQNKLQSVLKEGVALVERIQLLESEKKALEEHLVAAEEEKIMMVVISFTVVDLCLELASPRFVSNVFFEVCFVN